LIPSLLHSSRPFRYPVACQIAPITALGRFGVYAATFVVLITAALSPVAHAVEFPGPVVGPTIGSSLCGHRVRLPGNGKDHFVSGSGAGFLNLTGYNPVSRSYLVVHQLFVGGEVVSLTPWLGRPLGDSGFVIVTANPDRMMFVEVSPSFPNLRINQVVDLPEDPGDLVFVGNVAVGPWEIAVTLPGIDEVAFLAQDGSDWTIQYTMASGDHPGGLVAIDLDGDDLKELVVANTGPLSESLGIFRTQLNGLREFVVVELPGVKPALVAAIDLNNDAREEIAVGSAFSSEVVFYETSGDILLEVERAVLSFEPQTLHQNPLPDGSLGLFVSNSDRGLIELLNKSEGQWQRLDTYYPACRPWDFSFADIDGDGMDDLITYGGQTELLSGMLGNEKPGFWGFPALSLDKSPGDFDRSDINADGREDLLVADANQTTIRLFYGAGDGALSLTPDIWDLGFIPGRVMATNLDADATLELVALDIVNGNVVALNWDGAGALTQVSSISVGAFPFFVTSAYVDSDTHRDLVVLAQSQTEVNIIFGNGDGTFSETVSFGFGSRADRLVAMDLNADNRMDLVATDGQSRVWSKLNLGNREFGAESFVNAGAGALYLAPGDLDGDGDEDLVVANRTEQSLSFFENNSNGQLIRRIGGYALPGPPAGLVLADFDQDNRLDVLTNLQTEGSLGLVFGVTNWNYSLPVEIAGGPDMYAVDAADFNLDGVPDILTLDRSLRLGLTFLNVDPARVSVEPSSFAANCESGRLEMAIRPDRPGPWQLEVGHHGQWQTVVVDGRADVGRLDFERGSWYMSLRAEELRGWSSYAAASWQVRLTVGAGADRESATWTLPTDCLPNPDSAVRLLQWQDKPWPNPFNPVVQARFKLGQRGHVTAGVYDLAGRRVAMLIAREMSAGEHLVRWEGKTNDGAASAGTYFLRIETVANVITQKLVLVK
jgi:hypothetical protein